jgi:uncharacterized protein YndB with AHSA1/START domain
MSTGRLEQVDGGWRVRFTRRLNHPREKVWRALTEPEHLAAWFPTTIDGDRAEGAKLSFVFPHDEAPPMDGEMLEYRPPEAMEFRWGPDTLRFELRPDGSGTELVLLDLLEDKGKAARDGAGWHVCLDWLSRHLDGVPTEREGSDEWKGVHARYLAEYPADAGTIGPPEGMG